MAGVAVAGALAGAAPRAGGVAGFAGAGGVPRRAGGVVCALKIECVEGVDRAKPSTITEADRMRCMPRFYHGRLH